MAVSIQTLRAFRRARHSGKMIFLRSLEKTAAAGAAGCFWVRLESLWGPLGSFGEPLGVLWGALGFHLGVLGATF